MKQVFVAADGRLRASWRFLLGVAAFLASERVAGLVAGFIAGHEHPTVLIFLFQPLALVMVLLLFSLLLIRLDRVRERPLAAQGLSTAVPWVRQAVDGILLGAAMIVACVGAIRVLGGVTFEVNREPRAWLAAGAVLFLLAVAAMKEEVAFRGYPFQRLREAMGAPLAIMVMSFLFGLVHRNNPGATGWGLINTVVIGVLLALAYLRTNALWLPFGIHLGWNFTLGVVFGLPVSGIQEFAILVKGRASGPEWLTGGAYGIEASAVAAVVVLLGIVPVVVLYRPRRAEMREFPLPAENSDAFGHGGIQP